jgi:Rrf2 family transcriptional regulator, cysteine metabolism repressor
MKLITRNTDYAMRVLLYMARESEAKVTAAQLMAKLKIPGPFLRRLLQELGKHGILRSYKGKSGGFSLRVAPRKIRVLDVMRIFQGNIELTNCMFKKNICPQRGRCPLRAKVNAIEKKVIADFNAITVASLAGGG